jgi:hypothetical protein
MAKISLAILMALATYASAFHLVESDGKIKFDEPHIKYYMACLRGFSDGYGKGLYKNESEGTSAECLGESTYKNIIEFNKFLTSSNFLEIFKSIGKFYQIGFDIQKSCRFNEISFEVTGYCLNKTHDCTPKTLIANLQSNIFKITGAANNIAEVFFESYSNFGHEDVTKVDQASNTYTQLGRSFGDVSRTVLSFNKTRSEGGRRKRNPQVPPQKLMGDDHYEFDFEE